MRYAVRQIIITSIVALAASRAASAQEIVLHPSKATVIAGAWTTVADTTAAGGVRLQMPDTGQPKVTAPLANPANYFEMTFTATAGIPYRLWMRGKASLNSYNNDSAYVQFSGSVTASGAATFRIGTSSGTTYTVEDCTSCGVSGWGWNDNYYGATAGTLIYFATTGTQTLRVQNREDGLALDQIVLSPVLYVAGAPGPTKNDTTILDPLTGKPLGSSPPPSTTTTLRVMHWNTHHGGYGTDGVYSPDRIATWVARENPDLVSFNEIEKNTGWGNEDQPAKYKALLEQKTGHTWYMVWAQEYGNWDGNGKGNLIFSRFPWVATARYVLPYTRTVAQGQVVVNGRNVTFASTHLDPDYESRRLTEAEDLLAWESNFAENRIVVGDLNAQPTGETIVYMKGSYTDGWLAAKAGGFAYSASDNPYGYTRNSRIDYAMTSKSAANLKMIRFEVVDARDADGYMPSDHRPIVIDYAVN